MPEAPRPLFVHYRQRKTGPFAAASTGRRGPFPPMRRKTAGKPPGNAGFPTAFQLVDSEGFPRQSGASPPRAPWGGVRPPISFCGSHYKFSKFRGSWIRGDQS